MITPVSTTFTLETKGPDGPLAEMVARVAETTYDILKKGEAAKFAQALAQHGSQQQAEEVKTGSEVAPHQATARIIGDAMKDHVTPALYAAPSRVAQASEIIPPVPEIKTR